MIIMESIMCIMIEYVCYKKICRVLSITDSIFNISENIFMQYKYNE
jgi:hypothetical protein